MINKFLAGKKKYSVFITTLLVSAIQLFVVDPGQQRELGDMVPMMAMVLSGIVYLVVEGTRDIQREKTNTEYYKALNLGVVSTEPPNHTEIGIAPHKSSPGEPTSQPQKTPPEKFDVAGFHENIMSSVKATYTEVNPATVYYQARDKGMLTGCTHISQAEDYWDYLLSLAFDAEDYLRQAVQQTQKAQVCQPRDPAYYAMQRDVRNTVQCRENLRELAQSSIDWKAKLPPNYATLYNLGGLAGELLGK